MNDRSSFRLASGLVFGGELLYIGARQFHPGSVPPNQHPEVFAEYANSAYWGAVHMGQFLGMAVLLSGIVLLAFAFARRSDTLDWLACLAATSAVVTIALTGVLLAVDGVALKAAANAWLAAPVADQGARLAATEAVRWLEWAAGSYQLTMLGITLILVAAQIVVTVRIPRPIGVVVALSGFAYIVQGSWSVPKGSHRIWRFPDCWPSFSTSPGWSGWSLWRGRNRIRSGRWPLLRFPLSVTRK